MHRDFRRRFTSIKVTKLKVWIYFLINILSIGPISLNKAGILGISWIRCLCLPNLLATNMKWIYQLQGCVRRAPATAKPGVWVRSVLGRKKELCLISESRSKIPTGSLVCSVLLNSKTGQIRCKPNAFPVSAFSSLSSLVYLLLPGQERTRGQWRQPQTLEKATKQPESFGLCFFLLWGW